MLSGRNQRRKSFPYSALSTQHFGSWQAGRKEIIWTEEEGAKKLKWEVKQEDMQTNEGSRVENGHWKCKEEGKIKTKEKGYSYEIEGNSLKELEKGREVFQVWRRTGQKMIGDKNQEPI